MADSENPPQSGGKELAAILIAASNVGIAFYAFMPMGTAFAIGSSFGRAILTPLLVVALFQVGKRFRNKKSRYNVFLVMSVLVAFASAGRIINTATSSDLTPEQLVSMSLPNLNKGLPETLDNGIRIELYEAEGSKLVGNFLVLKSSKWDVANANWEMYLLMIEALPCTNPSYREMLEYGVVFEFRFRDEEGNSVATVETTLSDCSG